MVCVLDAAPRCNTDPDCHGIGEFVEMIDSVGGCGAGLQSASRERRPLNVAHPGSCACISPELIFPKHQPCAYVANPGLSLAT